MDVPRGNRFEGGAMTRTTRRDLVKLGGGAAALAALSRGATAPRASAATAAAAPSGLPVGYPLGPFVRDPANPILRPSNRIWESKFVFNPAAVVKDGLVQCSTAPRGRTGGPRSGLRRRRTAYASRDGTSR
jgi:hypothetical protein